MKKLILPILCLWMVFLICSCKKNTLVDVAFVGKDGNDICVKTINVDAENTSAFNLFQVVAFDNKLSFEEKDGMIVSIGGILPTDTEGWFFYINGEISPVGVKDYIPIKKDRIEMRYLSYAEAFPEFFSSEAESSSGSDSSFDNTVADGTYKSSLWYNPDQQVFLKIEGNRACVFTGDEQNFAQMNDYVKHDGHIEIINGNITYEIGYNKDVLYFNGYEFAVDQIPAEDKFDLQGVADEYNYYTFTSDGSLEFGVVNPSGAYEPYCTGTYTRDGNMLRCSLVAEELHNTVLSCNLYIDSENKKILTRIFEKID